MMIKINVIFLLLLTLTANADKVKLKHYKANYKVTYEDMTINSKEKMGLLGISMIFDIGSYWYAGFDVYGAIRGKRGGFFTTGLNTGFKLSPSKSFDIVSGLFVGAGGGGSAPQGGGLMLRPYMEINLKSDNFTIGAGLSHVEFPNGAISSTQGYLSLSIPTDGAFIDKHILTNNDIYDDTNPTKINDFDISFMMEHYIPNSSSLNTDAKTQTKPYTLAGVKSRKYINDSLYTIFETAGAGGGSSDGFMEILAGTGYRYQISDTSLYLTAEALVGAAGGGSVDTGGGIVYKAQLGADYTWGKHLTVSANSGLIGSLDGTLLANTYSATIGYKSSIIESLSRDNDTKTKTSAWSFRVLDKSYTDAKTLFKNSKPFDRIDLLGFSIDRYINQNIYLIGQTYWAYKGGAGGYAEGVVGVGYHTDNDDRFGAYIELLGGVGGGGGVNIGGGFFGSVGAGIDYKLDNNIDIFLASAYEKSKDGSFTTTALQAGFRYNFSLLESK